MGFYQKKPIIIEAVQFNGTKDNLVEVLRFSNSIDVFSSSELGIKTLEGVMRANIGDWIIKGIKGEFYPCKPDIFEATYEAV